MKKGLLFNSEINTTISQMGHTDKIVIADAGLPIPDTTKRIDIALTKGTPSFLETLDTILNDLEVEAIILAEEIKENNPSIHDEILRRFKEEKIQYLSHEEFKNITREAKAVVRTGECTPYANIILKSGVIF